MQPLPQGDPGPNDPPPSPADLTGVTPTPIDLAMAAPVITSVSPKLASTAGGASLTIGGRGFNKLAQVFINNAAAPISAITETSITVSVPPLPGKFGPATVLVRNPDNQKASNTNAANSATALSLVASQLNFLTNIVQIQYNDMRAGNLGDLNGDGFLDLVMPSLGNGNYTIYTGTGGGAFQPLRPSFNFGTIGGQGTHRVVLRDINKDGKMDALFSTSSSQLHYYLGNGTGRIDQITQTNYGAQNIGVSLDTGDFNGDGFDDVFYISGNNQQQYTIFYNTNNNGNLFSGGQSIITNTGSNIIWVDVLDIDKDGKKDAIMVGQTNGGPTIQAVIGTGVQGAPFNGIQSFGTNSNNEQPQAGIPGDFNNDGKIDYAVGDINTNTIRLFQGNGTATNSFVANPVLTMTSGQDVRRLQVADFNGDGNLDLIAVNHAGHTVTVYPGNGNFTFQSGVEFVAPFFPYHTDVGDLNKDGKPDFIVIARYNTIAQAAPGQLISYVNTSQ